MVIEHGLYECTIIDEKENEGIIFRRRDRDIEQRIFDRTQFQTFKVDDDDELFSTVSSEVDQEKILFKYSLFIFSVGFRSVLLYNSSSSTMSSLNDTNSRSHDSRNSRFYFHISRRFNDCLFLL